MSEVDYESGRIDGYERGRADEQERIIALFSKDLCEQCAAPEYVERPNLSCKDKANIIALINGELDE